MAIKSVNGKNVYVIEVEVPTPKTSTGQSFGNLVSDLRWDMFDKIQRDMLRSADVDMQTYKIAADSYNQQKKELENQIASLKELKFRAAERQGGSKDDLWKQSIRLAELNDRQNRPHMVKKTGKTGKDTYTWEAREYGTAEEKLIKTGTDYGSQTQTITQFDPNWKPLETDPMKIYQDLLNKRSKAQEDASTAEPGSADEDIAAARLLTIDNELNDLETKLQGLEAPQYTGIRDFTTASRRAFAQNMGYGGFGIQRRPGKFQSTYYEPEAIAALDKRIEGAQYNSFEQMYSDIAKKQSSYDKDIASINAKINEAKALQDELDKIDPNKEPEKYDEIATQLNALGDRITNAEIYVSKKYNINENNFKDGKFVPTAEEKAQAISRGSKQVVSDAQKLGARSVSDREFLGYAAPPELPDVSSPTRQPRQPRERYNPPGTNRQDTFGVALPGEAEIPGPESIPRNREVIDIPGAGPYSEPGAKGALPSRSMTKPGEIRYTPSDKVSEGTIPYDDYNIEQKFRNYSAETPGLYTGPGPAGLRSRAAGSNYVNTDVPVLSGPSKVDIAAEDMANAIAAEEAAARYGESDPASRLAAAQREAEFRALLGEDYQQMPRPAGARAPAGRMQPSPSAQMPIESRGGEAVPAWRRPAGLADRLALRNLEREQQAASVASPNVIPARSLPVDTTTLPEKKDEGQFDFEVGDIESKPISKAPATRESRRDLYLAKTIKKGIELANKPAKVERLAKTNLSEKERAKVIPEAIAVVDKVYEINRGKPNAFKLSFDEISRAFANRPTERQQAHEYLVAKDMLEGDKTKPLA